MRRFHYPRRPFIGFTLLGLLGLVSAAPGSSTDRPTTATGQHTDAWLRVSDTTRLICGGVPNATYDSRLRAVRQLGSSIPANDFQRLQAFLESDPKNDPAALLELNAIKNDVAGRLLLNEFLPDDFTDRFLAMVHAPQVGAVWQNYTLQFLDLLWKREPEPAKQRQIRDTLVAATADPRVSISGTALLTLSRLPPAAGLSKVQLGDLAIRMVASEQLPWQDKITALQIAAEAGDTRALTQARAWAGAAEEVPVMLRMSALAVLGQMGDDTDRPVLERFAKSGEFRLRRAAQAALKKLESKN